MLLHTSSLLTHRRTITHRLQYTYDHRVGAGPVFACLRSADGWWGAVRHAGTIFGLAPNEDAFDSFGLPYPDLGVTISQIQVRESFELSRALYSSVESAMAAV
jgi:hypothetical protein